MHTLDDPMSDYAPDLAGLPALDGRVAVVTGGARGVGLGCTVGLASLGATVVMLGRDGRHLAQQAALLVARGLDVVGRVADVTRPDDLSAAALALGPLGEPDILVCSAGVMSDKTAKTVRTTAPEWERVMAVNLTGVFATVQTFAAPMLHRRSGRVIVLSACLGRMSGPGCAGGLAPYRISKAAVNALVKNFAAEAGDGRRGVSVDAVCPGHCRTDMGGPGAPRSPAQGADSVLWLAAREQLTPTGLLWEDRQIVPW